jgi:hypothetical protein
MPGQDFEMSQDHLYSSLHIGFLCMFQYKFVLPPGDNPVAVNKYITKLSV